MAPTDAADAARPDATARGGPTLFVTYSGARGGAGGLLVEVAAALGRPAVVACPAGPVAAAARGRGLPVLELRTRPLERRGRTLAALAHLAGHARELRRAVHSLDPAVVVAWGMRSALAAAALQRGTPLLVRQHDLVPDRVTGLALRLALRRAGRAVVNSEAVRRDLGVEAEVVLPGVDLERFTPPADAPAGAPTALWLGAIVEGKRPGLAIEVAARVEDLRLVLAGEPLGTAGIRLRDELERRAAELDGTVELPGHLDDPVEALRSAHLLLHTADREAFGLALAEAMACGTPVVAPAVGGPAEIVDESCGRLYPPGDAAAAARAVEEVLRDRPALSRGARRRAEAEFSIARMCERFAALVGELAGPAGADPGAELSLVIVSHQSERELRRLLRSCRRHLPGAELVVVDSGSADGGPGLAQELGAALIRLDNVGYGRAANAGVAAAARPVTVVMNADLELTDASLAELGRELLRPAAPERLLAPAVVLRDGSRQDSAQHEPASAPLALHALAPHAVAPWRARRPRRVGWAVGACVAGRTETLRRLGPFDPDVFMYGEDLDLGLRAADAGVETWFWPSARVLHDRAHSTRAAFGGEPFELLARRRREVVGARRGSARLALDDALQALTFANRLALKALLRRETLRERAQLRALQTARRGR